MHSLRSPERNNYAKTCFFGLFLFFSLSFLFADDEGQLQTEPLHAEPNQPRQLDAEQPPPEPSDLVQSIGQPGLDEDVPRMIQLAAPGAEAKSEIASFELGDAEVSLSVSGFWKGTLQGNLGMAFSPLGVNAVSQDSPILFTQEADLTLDLWILNKWFVEASFMDDMDSFSFNTYRAGYQGLPGDIIQYAGIGNTGLDFPVFPYLDLGGDSPSSFGFYGNFQGGPFQFHSLLRWDQAAREERTFVGGRERTYTYVSLRNSGRGFSFVLPDTSLDSDPQIYVEDETGDLRDNYSRRWRLLGPSEYAAGRNSGIVELNVIPQGMVAVAYSKDGSSRPWELSLGTYGNPLLPASGSGFLGEAQEHFGEKFPLASYPQCGGENTMPGISSGMPGTRIINGTPVLVLHESGTFSPFERRSRYMAPSSITSDAALVSLATLKRVTGYELVELDNSSISLEIPLYGDSGINRLLFELVRAGETNSRSPITRWPLGADYLSVYLPGASASEEDINIRFTNYGESGNYFIGTDVVPGSVQVWRAGMLDTNFSYTASSGAVLLTSPVGLNEVIRITYLKQSSETKLGSFAAGFGVQYQKDNSPLSSELALGLRWNLNTSESFTEEGVSNPGTVGLSTNVALNYDNFRAKVSAGVNFEQPDATGLYRAAGMEGNETVLEFHPDESFISHLPLSASSDPLFSDLSLSSRANLIFRNYRDSAVLGNNLMGIDWEGARLVQSENRPYPVRDPELRTNVLAAEFMLDSENTWTGFMLPVYEDTHTLSRAREIEIPFRFYGFNKNPPSGFRVILQIGALAGKDHFYQENTLLVYEKLLYDSNGDSSPPAFSSPSNPVEFTNTARIARFVLNDIDRLRLGDARYFRIIVLHGDAHSGVPGADNADTIEGRILFAPPIVRGAGFRPIIVSSNGISGSSMSVYGANVQAKEIREIAAESLRDRYKGTIDRLHPDKQSQQVLRVDWDGMQPGDSAGADSRIGSLPLSNYRALSFFVKGPAQTDGTTFTDSSGGTGGSLRFIVGQGPSSLGKASETYLDAELPLSALSPGKWSKVTIRYQGNDKGVLVDDVPVKSAVFQYRRQPVIAGSDLPVGKSMYTAVFVNPHPQNINAASMPGNQLAAGNFCIDEIILEDSAPLYRLNGGLTAEYKLPGTLLAIKKFPLLADFSVFTALEAEARGDPFSEERDSGSGINSRSSMGVSLLGAKLNGTFAFSGSEDRFDWNVGHGILRSFGPVQVSESFSASPSDNTLDHRVALNLSGIFRTRLNAGVYHEFGRQERKWNVNMGLDVPPNAKRNAKQSYIPAINLDAAAAWTSDTGQINNDYGQLWTESWQPLLPDLGADASKREISGLISLNEKTVPVGGILAVEGNTAFISNIDTTRSNYKARLEIPMDFNATKLNVKMERGFDRHLQFSGLDALDDAKKFGEGISDSLPLWGVFPFYSLFAPELTAALDKGLEASPSADAALYTRFKDLFGITGYFPSFYDIRAFFIPSQASASMERVLEQKMDTQLDILYLRGNLAFSAINMFGAFGYKPLFQFYLSDDFSQMLDAAIAIPASEDISYRVQWSAGASFRNFTGAELGINNTFTVGSAGWLESLRVELNIPRNSSLLGILYDWVASISGTQSSWLGVSAFMNKPYDQILKESLEMSFDYSSDYPSWALVISHEAIVRIIGQLHFSVFAKLQCGHSERSKTLSFIGTLGTTLNVMF